MVFPKKLVVDIPDELEGRIQQTREKQMISKAAVVRLAVSNYCDKVLYND